MFSELKSFFEINELARQAASSIKNGREIGLMIVFNNENPAKQEGYTFTREGNRNVLREGFPSHPDLRFTIPEAAASELITRQFDTIGQVGLYIFEKMLSPDPAQKIHVQLKIGILSLITGGYLGVLTSGGAETAKFLASKGLGNMGKLKEAISKFRSSSPHD